MPPPSAGSRPRRRRLAPALALDVLPARDLYPSHHRFPRRIVCDRKHVRVARLRPRALAAGARVYPCIVRRPRDLAPRNPRRNQLCIGSGTLCHHRAAAARLACEGDGRAASGLRCICGRFARAVPPRGLAPHFHFHPHLTPPHSSTLLTRPASRDPAHASPMTTLCGAVKPGAHPCLRSPYKIPLLTRHAHAWGAVRDHTLRANPTTRGRQRSERASMSFRANRPEQPHGPWQKTRPGGRVTLCARRRLACACGHTSHFGPDAGAGSQRRVEVRAASCRKRATASIRARRGRGDVCATGYAYV